MIREQGSPDPLRALLVRARPMISARYLGMPEGERAELRWLLAAIALYSIHFLVFCWPQPFFIEDAAITFAYARNLAEGDGLVPYVGGERVEGYSNPLWTFLIAFWHLLFIPPWTSAKVMGWGFGVLTQVLVWRLSRQALPDSPHKWAVIPPFLLATSTQFAVWTASGLENALFCVLLATGAWALLRDAERPRGFPWSALAFSGLALTRPDGLAYVVVGFMARLMLAATRRQWLSPLIWLVVATVPVGAYQLFRMDYYSWPWPNTYYAKQRIFRPWVWSSDGWKKFREYLFNYGIIFAFPGVALALLGERRWLRVLGAALLGWIGVLTLWDGRVGLPTELQSWFNKTISHKWAEIRVGSVLFAAVFAGLATLGRPGWATRGALWAAWCTGAFFSIWSNGDWMKGFRWYSLTIVPQSVLVGLGIGLFSEGLPWANRLLAGRIAVGSVYALLFTVALGAVNVPYSYDFAFTPETSVRDVHRRVTYMREVQEKLELEHVKLMDVDMGAHMWYTNWEITDYAGLIDVSVAHHKWVKAFIDDYIWEERRPDFAHVHGAWTRTTKIPDQPWFKENYVEIPGYPLGPRTVHIGNHIRKDLLLRAKPTSGVPEVRFAGGALTLKDWDVPSPVVAPGGRLFIRTTWSGLSQGFRVVAFLSKSGTVAASGELAPGLDWYVASKWKEGELVTGDGYLPLPDSIEEGVYDLGFVLYEPGSTGRVMAWVAGAEASPPVPVFSRGEFRAEGVVTIVGRAKAIRAAEAGRSRALALAAAGECEEARESFRDAKRHISRDKRWHEAQKDTMNTAFIECYIAESGRRTDLLERAALLVEAKWIDPRDPTMLAAAGALGAKLEAGAALANGSGDLARAQRLYVAAVNVDGRRAAARRAAEELRDRRLGLNGVELDKKAKVPDAGLKKALNRSATAPTPDVVPAPAENAEGEGGP